MHLFKRLAGGILALALIITILPAAYARQFYSDILDASDADEIAVMLAGIEDQTFTCTDAATVRSYIEHFLYNSSFSAVYGGRFPYTNAQGYWGGKTVTDGTYTEVVSATGCFAYCKLVVQTIYDTPGMRRDLNERAGKITGEGLKNFLKQYAQAGEHIRVDSKHSVTYISGNEDGFYYMDYAGDQSPRILLRYSTYNNFAARCNELYKRVWIYEADWAVNVDKPEEPESYEPADWMSEYVTAAEELGLTNSGNTLSYDSQLTLAETVTFVARAHSLFTVGGVEFDTANAVNWYDPYVNYLTANGILNTGLEYTTLVTREQFVSLLYAAVPADMPLECLQPAVEFVDAGEIDDYWAVHAMAQAGVLTGTAAENGVYFQPDDHITRGEALALLIRLVLPTYRVGI